MAEIFAVLGVLAALSTGPELPPIPHHPHDPISALAISPDYARDRTLFVASHESMNVFLVSRDAGQTWSESRAGLVGVFVGDVAFAPDWSESGTVYCLMKWTGIQRSTDRGHSWQAPLTRRAVHDMAVTPVTADGGHEVYYTTANAVWRWRGHAGQEQLVWTAPDDQRLVDIAVSPTYASDGTVAIVSADGTVRTSTDRGASWRVAAAGGAPRAISFSAGFGADRTIWLATFGAGVWCSTDAGSSFARVSALPARDVNDVRTAPDGRTVWAATRADGVFASHDAGGGWQPLAHAVPISDQSDNHYTHVRPSPTFDEDRTLLSGTFEGLYLSADGGATWRKSQIKPTRMGRLLAMPAGFERHGVAFGTGYGMHVLCTEDSGRTWCLRATDYRARSTYALASSPDFERDQLIVSGSNGYVMMSSDRGRSWTRRDLPYDDGERPSVVWGVAFSPAFAADRTLYAAGDGPLFRSVDAGETWSRLSSVPDARTIALSPGFGDDRTLFVGARTVHRSGDGGRTFTELDCPQRIDALAVAPDFATSRQVFAAGKQAGAFYRSDDAGETWLRRADGLGREAPLAMTCVADAEGRPVLFLTTMGAGLFRSADRGESWQLLSRPGTGFSLAASSGEPGAATVLLGGYDGLYRSEDGGVRWSRLFPAAVYDTERQPWQRSAGWQFTSPPDSLGLGVHRSGQPGATMRLPFVGACVRVVGAVGPEHGAARLSVADRTVEVDCYAPEPRGQVLLASFSDLPDESHELRVEVLGGRDGRQGGVVTIDAAEVCDDGATLLPDLHVRAAHPSAPLWPWLAIPGVAALLLFAARRRRAA